MKLTAEEYLEILHDNAEMWEYHTSFEINAHLKYKRYVHAAWERFRMPFDMIIYEVLFSLRVTVCHFIDHDLVDDGYATPEHGCIAMRCRRCGYSYPTTWLY